MLAGILGLVILIIRLFPGTSMARSLHRAFVEWPLEMTHRLERRHLILLAIIVCTGHLALALGSAELVLAYAVDLSIYADAALATYFATAVSRVRTAISAFRVGVVRILHGARRIRPRSRRKATTAVHRSDPANDDDPAWWVARLVA